MRRLSVPTAAVGLLLLGSVVATPVFAQGKGNGNANGLGNGNGPGTGNGNGNGSISFAATPEVDSIVMLGSALAGGLGYLALQRRASGRR